MVELSSGAWLFPMYYSLESPGHGDDYSVMQRSQDQGQTWQEVFVPGSRGRVQPSVVELAPGRLLAFLRSRAADRIYVSRSQDDGRSWSAPRPTLLPNNNSSIQAVHLQSGRVAMVFNHFSANNDPAKTVWPAVRYPVTVALSEDEGQTWPYMRNIDPSDGLVGVNQPLNRGGGYPCILQTRDGDLHIAYSYRPRQCIKYVRVNEAWVMGQLDWLW
jgi:predicted neuraminidase